MARKATFTTIKLPAAIKRELNKRFAAELKRVREPAMKVTEVAVSRNGEKAAFLLKPIGKQPMARAFVEIHASVDKYDRSRSFDYVVHALDWVRSNTEIVKAKRLCQQHARNVIAALRTNNYEGFGDYRIQDAIATDDEYVDTMCGVSDSLTRAVIGLKNEQDKAAA